MLALDQERRRTQLWQQGSTPARGGCQAECYLPEVVGFNFGYEQLPLHLLITTYELDELALPPTTSRYT